jgi:predicted flap endonuclease-1-like 5' DNA nuclease
MIPVFASVSTNFTKIDGKALVASIEHLDKNIAPDSQIVKSLRGEKDMDKAPNPSKATLPDVNLIGQKLFTDYNFPLQVVGVLLLVATIGCVTLSKKLHGDEPDGDIDHRMAKTLAKSSTIPQVNAATIKENSKPKAVTTKKVKSPKTKNISSPESAKSDEKLGVIYDSRPDDADDLTGLNGVGPVIADKLNDLGIYTFKQIADWTEENKSEFDILLSFKGRIDRDDWISQATELHSNKSI